MGIVWAVLLVIGLVAAFTFPIWLFLYWQGLRFRASAQALHRQFGGNLQCHSYLGYIQHISLRNAKLPGGIAFDLQDELRRSGSVQAGQAGRVSTASRVYVLRLHKPLPVACSVNLFLTRRKLEQWKANPGQQHCWPGHGTEIPPELAPMKEWLIITHANEMPPRFSLWNSPKGLTIEFYNFGLTSQARADTIARFLTALGKLYTRPWPRSGKEDAAPGEA